ncbi:MAG: tetratricopeptide repeat protein, partial [Lentisphaeria bacterium]
LQAECLSMESQYEKACVTLVNALELYKNDAYISYLYPRLFQLHLVLGSDENALELADEFLIKYSESEQAGEVIYLLGDYWYNKRNYRKAADYYGLLVAKFPENSNRFSAWYQAALATATFDKGEAVKILRSILEIKGIDAKRRGEVMLTIGNFESDLGNYKKALEALELPLDIAKDERLYHMLQGRLADMYFILGENVKSQEIYEGLLRLVSEENLREQIQFKLSEVHIEMKQFEKSEELLHDIIYQYRSEAAEGKVRNWQYFVRAIYVLSDYYVRTERIDKAILVLERLASLTQLHTSREAKARISILSGKN